MVVAYRATTPGINEFERDANRFAAALLMPSPLVRQSWHITHDVPVLADWFKVSFGAMSRRIREVVS